jgi:hypothetical protein
VGQVFIYVYIKRSQKLAKDQSLTQYYIYKILIYYVITTKNLETLPQVFKITLKTQNFQQHDSSVTFTCNFQFFTLDGSITQTNKNAFFHSSESKVKCHSKGRRLFFDVD